MSYLDSRFAELHAELEQGKLDSKAKAKAAELALKAPVKEQKVDPTSTDWQTVPVGDDFLKDPDSPMINGEETRLSGPVGFSPDAPEIEGAKRYKKNPRALEQHQRNFENKFGFTPNEEELNLWERTQRADSQEFLTRDTPEGENPTAEIRYTGRESHGRPVIEARNRAGESLGEYQSESERNVAYDSPYNRAQQHEDIVSGKYGSEIAGDYSRGPGEILQDTASAVGQAALVSTGRLIGEVGKITGAMPDSWVEGIHEGTNAVDEWFDGLKGLSLDKQREKYESWQAIREKDRPARIAKLVEGGMSQTKAETYDMVDDAWNTLRALSKNPTVALDSVASVAGQLLPNVVGGAAVGKVATKVMTKMAKGKALTAAEKATVQKIQGATGITQGAMTEGAHASYDLRNNILDTDFDTLAENSEVYRQNLETTNGDKEKARALTADSEATKTFLLNSTVMGASSAVLAKAGLSMESAAGKGFRGLAPKLAPLEGGAKAGLARTAGATGKSAVGNVLEEGGVQEPLNQAIENYFAQRNIDPEQSLLQGVGRAAAEGAVGGAGSGGVMGGASQAVTEGARGVRGRPGTPIADAIDAGITAAGETHGLPDIAVSKLRSITDIESGWGANMRGKAIGTEISGDMTHAGDRAMGPFQFMTKTAQGYGLKDRMDPTQSADAAARLLKDNYNTIKKAMPGLSEEELWHKAALAHHSGAGNVIKGKLGKWGKDYDQKLRKRGGSYFKGKATPTGTGSQASGVTVTPEDRAEHIRATAVAEKSKQETGTVKAEPAKEVTVDKALNDFDGLMGKYEDKRNFTQEEAREITTAGNSLTSALLAEFKKTGNPELRQQALETMQVTKSIQASTQGKAVDQSITALGSPDTAAALTEKATPEQQKKYQSNLSTARDAARNGLLEGKDLSNLPDQVRTILEGARAEGELQNKVFDEKFGEGVGSTGPGVQNHNNKINQAIDTNDAPAAQEALGKFQNFTSSQRAKANEWEKAADIASQLQPGEKSTYQAPEGMKGAPRQNLENVAKLRDRAETYGKEAAAMEQMAAGHQASIEQMAPAPETTEEATPVPKEAAPKPKEKAAKKPEKAPEAKPEPKVKKAEETPAEPVKTDKKPAAELSVAEAQEELDALRQNAAEYGDYMTDEEYNRDLARAKELNARIKQGETELTADEVLDQQEAELKAKTKAANEKVTTEKPTPKPKQETPNPFYSTLNTDEGRKSLRDIAAGFGKKVSFVKITTDRADKQNEEILGFQPHNQPDVIQLNPNPKLWQDSWNAKVWTKPAQLIDQLHKGENSSATALPEGIFQNEQQFVEFMLYHELGHTQNTRQENQTEAQWEDVANNWALGELGLRPKATGEQQGLSLENSAIKKEPHFTKDNAKAKAANKFIGVGKVGSSTHAYRKALKKDYPESLIEEYKETDKVFVSVNGNTKGRIHFNRVRPAVYKAIEAGATIIADKPGKRPPNKTYNVGEKELADYLEEHDYVETPGSVFSTWKPKKKERGSTEQQTNISSNSTGLLAALTNPTELAKRKPAELEAPPARSLSEVTIELDGKPVNAAVERDAISSLTEQLKMIKSICQ